MITCFYAKGKMLKHVQKCQALSKTCIQCGFFSLNVLACLTVIDTIFVGIVVHINNDVLDVSDFYFMRDILFIMYKNEIKR